MKVHGVTSLGRSVSSVLVVLVLAVAGSCGMPVPASPSASARPPASVAPGSPSAPPPASVVAGLPSPAARPPGTIAPNSPPPATTAVIVGRVTAGPVCPVERNPPDPACAPRPVAGAVIVVTYSGGATVVRATSEADGSYRVALPRAGTVIVTAEPVQGLMRQPAPVTATVTAGETLSVDLEYDTGIR